MSVTPFLVISASTVSGLSATVEVSAMKFSAGAASYDCGKAIGNRGGIAHTHGMSSARITEAQRRFVAATRVGRLATAEPGGMPHEIPVCYALGEDTLYITIDEKPKRHDVPLKRVRNILENPHAAFEVDRYDDENWTRLGWVMLRGPAEILYDGPEHDRAQAMLRARYR